MSSGMLLFAIHHCFLYNFYHLMLLMYMVHVNRCLQYLRDSIISAGSEPERHHLHSATNLNYILLRTRTKFGERAFSVSGSNAWNHQPLSVRLSPTLTGSNQIQNRSFLQVHKHEPYYLSTLRTLITMSCFDSILLICLSARGCLA